MTHAPTTILLFDDEPMLRDATAMMLARRGGRVTTAASLDEALELARERIYDVAVLDLSSTSPSASAVVAAMRAAGCLPRRFVVCVDVEARAEAGAFHEVLEKPFDFEQLVALVFAHRGERKPSRSGVFPQARRTVVPIHRRGRPVRVPRPRVARARRGSAE
jgi:DNA-binding response OmpR family regulator